MKVVLISGKARHGKDTFAEMVRQKLVAKGHRVLVTHYADLLKYVCKTFFGWNGEKDEAGRQILQYVGTDIIREKEPDFWVDFIVRVLKLFPDEWDYVLIPDTRFPNEIDKMRDAGFDVTYLRIIRPEFDNGLTGEQKSHKSETALDHIKADIYLINAGTLEELENNAGFFVDDVCLLGA